MWLLINQEQHSWPYLLPSKPFWGLWHWITPVTRKSSPAPLGNSLPISVKAGKARGNNQDGPLILQNGQVLWSTLPVLITRSLTLFPCLCKLSMPSPSYFELDCKYIPWSNKLFHNSVMYLRKCTNLLSLTDVKRFTCRELDFKGQVTSSTKDKLASSYSWTWFSDYVLFIQQQAHS